MYSSRNSLGSKNGLFGFNNDNESHILVSFRNDVAEITTDLDQEMVQKINSDFKSYQLPPFSDDYLDFELNNYFVTQSEHISATKNNHDKDIAGDDKCVEIDDMKDDYSMKCLNTKMYTNTQQSLEHVRRQMKNENDEEESDEDEFQIPLRQATKSPRAIYKPLREDPSGSLSPYILFCNERRALIRKENPKIGARDVMKKLSQLWRNAGHEIRKRYSEKSQKLNSVENEKIITYRKQKASEERMTLKRDVTESESTEDELSTWEDSTKRYVPSDDICSSFLEDNDKNLDGKSSSYMYRTVENKDYRLFSLFQDSISESHVRSDDDGNSSSSRDTNTETSIHSDDDKSWSLVSSNNMETTNNCIEVPSMKSTSYAVEKTKGRKMGPRPDHFDEDAIRSTPTFIRWDQLPAGRSLNYSGREFLKGNVIDEERLMRRIMICKKRNQSATIERSAAAERVKEKKSEKKKARLTGYQLFTREFSKTVGNNASVTDIFKMASESWNVLDIDEKNKFKSRAEELINKVSYICSILIHCKLLHTLLILEFVIDIVKNEKLDKTISFSLSVVQSRFQLKSSGYCSK